MTFHAGRFDWNEELEEPCDTESSSDTDSVLSDGEDLKADFEDALSGVYKASSNYNYFHCHTDPCAPNPGLKIEGVGNVSLPLSERDAQAIISVATPIRVGEEQDVGGAWEVEATKVEIRNANWDSYLATNAILAACETLGVGQLTHVKPQCDLDKLVLLSASESQFVLRQEGFHTEGIFATIAVILSSSFEGGQVHVSYGEEDFLIDVSDNSAFATSILAWYNEAALKILPVTSGYRLALMYNLIHSSSESPQPSLHRPPVNPSESLPCIFRKWKEGKYRQTPSSQVLACPLSNNYREPDLKHGVSILEGSDVDKVEYILPLAEKYGFTVCLANLESNTVGHTSPLKTELERYSVFNLVCLTADRKPCFDGLDISDDSIVLDRDIAPQLTVSERLTQRTILLIFRDNDEPSLAILSQGIEETLRKIKHEPQILNAKQIAYAVLSNLAHAKSEIDDPRCNEQLRISAARDLMDWAVSWRDVPLWTGAFPHSSGTLKFICNELRKALHVFGVKPIHDSITDLLTRIPQLQNRIRVIEVVVPFLSDEVGPRWADSTMGSALSLYQEANIEDIPILLEFAKRRFGLEFICDRQGLSDILHFTVD
ncbi:hypothetical protein EST38_g9378 [Candolleomyces aberdarensis]|uniref:Uncharacterized protein n=1 Tax=Candolleomyces aberdarensis TaxID=2316362 RepID=A0A4Q2DCE6_9AGAR|nr:hypothetical protein EST38_g9378 [Candolleomyces aberdarensis]